ncbi:pimeloyl-ACP methyl ester carboxylesterase [Lacibacter cauensis]|uniref:Pimeloyl-ACP methyl ester carboxylesterase n=1 Tax=Lacibacter cauensis TaxID=510947 RepID=A0A562SXW3_9BACT|nr:alpha/beta hydrolase [Lacibacter cauensis]TWI85754.1 pimeloyl-ACP methyl ester carboxylesterase [Lacibacter cauensis]
MTSSINFPTSYHVNPEVNEWLSKGSFFNYQGLDIFYRDEGGGPCLLITHGYPYNGFDFKEILPVLIKDYRVLIPDMPGMGFSDKPDKHRYSFEEMADVYATLLNEMNITDVHMLAHDLGNSVVQELIARSGENKNSFHIRSIAFLNGGLFTDVYKPRLIQILLSKSPKPIGRLFSKLMTRTMVTKATAEVFGKHTKPAPELLDCFWKILNYKNGKAITYLLGRLIFEKVNYQHRWINAMQNTSIPMCFINGPADPNSGMHMANRYRDIIPNPKIYLLSEHIGHWPQIEAPEEVLSAFYAFHRNSNSYSK